MCLRITAPFLPSTRALSVVRWGRDLVNSISSLFAVEAENAEWELVQHGLEHGD